MALVTRAGSRLTRQVVASSIGPVGDVRVGCLLILVGALLVEIARGLILVGRRLILITPRLVLIRRAFVTAELESLAVVTQRFITHGLPPRSVQPMAESIARRSFQMIHREPRPNRARSNAPKPTFRSRFR
jgi:hypothetical protein